MFGFGMLVQIPVFLSVHTIYTSMVVKFSLSVELLDVKTLEALMWGTANIRK